MKENFRSANKCKQQNDQGIGNIKCQVYSNKGEGRRPPHCTQIALGPQNHAGQPILENPNFEKSVHNIEITYSIDLKTMNLTSEHPNHPTIIFSEFMDKEWGEAQTEGGEGVNSGGK